MSPVRGAVALAMGALCVASEGCLLAYDFDEYGAGGASASSGSGGSCEEQRMFVLPADWADVRVARRGASFVAAPRDTLSYVRLEEGAPLSEPQPRDDATEGLAGIFALGVSDVDQVFGVAQDDADIKLAGFTVGDPADTIPTRTFLSVQQITRDFAAMLVSHEADDASALLAKLIIMTWGGDAPRADYVLGDAPVGYCSLGTCEFLSASLAFYADESSQIVIIGDAASSDAQVNDVEVGAGAFAIRYTSLEGQEPTVEVLPLGDLMDSAVAVDASLEWIVGERSGRHAKLELEGRRVVELGAVDPAGGSAVSGRHWAVTERADGGPVARVYRVDVEEPPVLEVAGAVVSGVASTPRSDPNSEGVLMAVVVGASDVVIGGCTLPAGRSVLVETDVVAR